MSVWWIVVAVVIAVVVLAVAGVIALVILHGLAADPARADVRRVIAPDEVDEYFRKKASFAITIEEATPLSRSEVYERLSAHPYLSSLPFLDGPTPLDESGNPVERDGKEGLAVGDRRSFSGTILSVSERVIAVEPRRSWTLVGTGLSLPLIIDSFAERWTLSEGERGRLNVRWEIAGSPRWVGWLPWRLGAPLLRPILAFVLRHALRLKPFRRMKVDDSAD